jgi:hypothetical protein
MYRTEHCRINTSWSNMMILLMFVTSVFLSSQQVEGFSLSMMSSSTSSSSSVSSATSRKGTTIVAGATGYIGKSTVRESVRQGYHTVALVRDLKKVQSAEGKRLYGECFEGAEVIECDVSDPLQLAEVRADHSYNQYH